MNLRTAGGIQIGVVLSSNELVLAQNVASGPLVNNRNRIQILVGGIYMSEYDQDPQSIERPGPRLRTYVANLELEVDRLRRHGRLVHRVVRENLRVIEQLLMEKAAAESEPSALQHAVQQLIENIVDLQDVPGYHPAFDQVLAIAVRPLAERVFRWQVRAYDASDVTLQLDLESEHIDWFPSRLLQILDNLISNAVKFRDPDKNQAWIKVGLRVSPTGYELQVADNGIGMESAERAQILELKYRLAPAQADTVGVGLAVVKSLVEESGGTLTVDSGFEQGTTIVTELPRYEIDDYLT